MSVQAIAIGLFVLALFYLLYRNKHKDDSKNHNNRQYKIEISMSGGNVTNLKSAKNIDNIMSTLSDPVVKNENWFIDQNINDFLITLYKNNDGIWTGSNGIYVTVRDVETNEIINLTEEEQQNVHWSSPDTDLFKIINGSMNGSWMVLATYQSCRVRFTVTYENAVANSTILFVNRGTVNSFLYSPSDIKKAYIFNIGEDTNDLNLADFWYTVSDGVNYINAPSGVALILNSEQYPNPELGTNWTIVGSVLKVPDNLVYSTYMPCVWYGTFIVKTHSGGYVKITSFLAPEHNINVPAGFLYEYSSNGEFQLHW